MPNLTHTQNGFGVKGTDWCIFPYAGVPDATIGAGFAGKGSVCCDTTNGNAYINGGTKGTPAWKLVTKAV